MTAPSGLVVVDKPGGLTSHDVVARIRRLAGTRRVGHAGTLDPMATGVLLVGVEKATRLLGYLALTEKEYAATVRLGQATDSGDADGQVTATVPARGITRDQLAAAAAALTGEIDQVPPGISAIKVGGKRAYQLARAGQAPELAARRVTVRELAIGDVRPDGDLLDVDITVTCSSGTYIRAIARDLGDALGVGGHLTALRRTRVGPVPHRGGPHPGRARRLVRAHPAAGRRRGSVPAPGPDRPGSGPGVARGAAARGRHRDRAGRRVRPGRRPDRTADRGGRPGRSLAVFVP